MFEVTEKAAEMLSSALKDRNPVPPIRIALFEGGWSGPSLGMALDEPKAEDVVFQERGFTFLVDPKLLDDIKPVKIDFIEIGSRSGFKIDSSMAPRSCGSSCSCWDGRQAGRTGCFLF